jgi:enamine deaminase RidA (YjgF/YER057c/UK114 family)
LLGGAIVSAFALLGNKREYLPIIEEARVALFGDHKPADVLVGVATLSNPDYLIEVDAIAVIDYTPRA